MGGMLGGGGECALDVKDGKVLRIRPFHYDWKYDGASFRPWKIERNGEDAGATHEGSARDLFPGLQKTYLLPNRIKYPMKRVDWDPNGERNTQNRGISKYERISWDEVTDIIAAEIRRIP